MRFQLPSTALVIILALPFAPTGCALHYYNPENGVEYLWGIGCMKMRVAPENEEVTAVVTSTRQLGLGIGVGREERYLVAGWDCRERLTVMEDRQVRLEGPRGTLFNLRVGTQPPSADAYPLSPGEGAK